MKRLLVIDSSVTFASPAMRCWLAASDGFSAKFDEIEVWANDCQLNAPNVKFSPVRKLSFAGPFGYFLYLNEVRRRFAHLSQQYLNDTLVQCTGCMVPFADVRFTHFWDTAYLEVA